MNYGCHWEIRSVVWSLINGLGIRRSRMLFKLAGTHTPEARDTAIKQFMATGGTPLEGISMVSGYHNLDGIGGFSILDTTDSAALADHALDRNGLIKIEITAIMNDETISSVLPKYFG